MKRTGLIGSYLYNNTFDFLRVWRDIPNWCSLGVDLFMTILTEGLLLIVALSGVIHTAHIIGHFFGWFDMDIMLTTYSTYFALVTVFGYTCYLVLLIYVVSKVWTVTGLSAKICKPVTWN